MTTFTEPSPSLRPQVYIVPGYQASPQDHWFVWLANKIQTMDAEVSIVKFTEPDHPQFEQWQHDLNQQIHRLDAQTIIIAHSLGCISTVAYLSRHLKERRLKSLICVSGFYETLSALPELDHYMQQIQMDDGIIRTHIQHRYVFFSNNDPLVPAPLSIRFGQLLNAQMFEQKQAGHFMAADGYTQFPQLWERVERLLTTSLTP